MMKQMMEAAAGSSLGIPSKLHKIEAKSQKAGFIQYSDIKTGRLLRTLVASKNNIDGAKILELGTGAGHAAAWMLDSLATNGSILTVDKDETIAQIAIDVLGDDKRIKFDTGRPAIELLCELNQNEEKFDLIFADAWDGKYSYLEEALQLLKPGGLYIADDMLPQPHWPEGQEYKIPFLQQFESRSDVYLWPLCWGTGFLIVVKK